MGFLFFNERGLAMDIYDFELFPKCIIVHYIYKDWRVPMVRNKRYGQFVYAL